MSTINTLSLKSHSSGWGTFYVCEQQFGLHFQTMVVFKERFNAVLYNSAFYR